MGSQSNLLDGHNRRLYRPHLLLDEIGETGQAKLLQSKVLVAGVGGLGSPAAIYLAACGVGELGIADEDRVELSNLQRQIVHRFDDIGKDKVASAAQNLLQLQPNLSIKTYPVRITRENGTAIVSRYDFVIDGTDTFESKFAVNDLCVQLRRPFSHAGISGFHGQTMTIVPGRGPCLRCLFEDAISGDAVQANDLTGILGTVPGVLGAIQATEAIKYLVACGELLVGRMLTWNALNMEFREVQLPMEKRCPVCQRADG